MAVVSVLGPSLSLLFLTVGGQVSMTGWLVGAGLLPFTSLGFAVSSPLRRYVDGRWIRPCVLLVSAASALLLVLRACSADARSSAGNAPTASFSRR